MDSTPNTSSIGNRIFSRKPVPNSPLPNPSPKQLSNLLKEQLATRVHKFHMLVTSLGKHKVVNDDLS